MVLAESGGHGNSPSRGNAPAPDCIGLLDRVLLHSNTEPSALLAPDVSNDEPLMDIMSKYDATLEADVDSDELALDLELVAERGPRCRRRRGRGLHCGPLSRI